MLFDLQSPGRRRIVRIVYGFLAASFLVGFVVFGIGSGGLGSLADALGIGNGSSSSSSSSAFDQPINHAKEILRKDPKNEQALKNLATNEYSAGNAALGVSDSGSSVMTDEARSNYEAATGAWQRYLKVTKKPDPGTAGTMVNAYFALMQAAASDTPQDLLGIQTNAEGAAQAQQIVATDNPGYGTYGSLAQYLYYSGKIGPGDAAASKAVAKAPASSRKAARQQFDQARKVGLQLKKALAAGGKAAGKQALQNPLGGLGTPTTPTTP